MVESAPTQRADSVALIARSVEALFGASTESPPWAARSIRELLDPRPATLIAALNQALRSKGFWRRLGLPMPMISLEMFERATRTANVELIAAVVGSCTRDGRVRQAAVQTLAQRPSALGLSALLVRLTDPVSEISAAAWEAASPRINVANVSEVAASVSLIPKFATWERGGAWPVRERMAAVLCLGEAGALWRAAVAKAADDRFAACLLLAEKYADSPRLAQVLQHALDDSDPQTRWWAAKRASDRSATPAAVADGLVPVLLEDASPAIRLLGLRRLARDVSSYSVSLRRFVCDSNANVRFFARRFLNRLGEPVDTRGQALAILGEADATAGDVVGALGALSESGLAQDRSTVASFCESQVSRVAKEANRTLSLL